MGWGYGSDRAPRELKRSTAALTNVKAAVVQEGWFSQTDAFETGDCAKSSRSFCEDPIVCFVGYSWNTKVPGQRPDSTKGLRGPHPSRSDLAPILWPTSDPEPCNVRRTSDDAMTWLVLGLHLEPLFHNVAYNPHSSGGEMLVVDEPCFPVLVTELHDHLRRFHRRCLI